MALTATPLTAMTPCASDGGEPFLVGDRGQTVTPLMLESVAATTFSAAGIGAAMPSRVGLFHFSAPRAPFFSSASRFAPRLRDESARAAFFVSSAAPCAAFLCRAVGIFSPFGLSDHHFFVLHRGLRQCFFVLLAYLNDLLEPRVQVNSLLL